MDVAQLVEHQIVALGAVGSNPTIHPIIGENFLVKRYLLLLLFLVQTNNAMHMQLKALREAKLHSFEKHLEYKRQFSSTTTTGLAIVRSDDKQRFREYLDGLRIYIQRDEATTSMLLIDLDYSVFRAAFLNKNLCQLFFHQLQYKH